MSLTPWPPYTGAAPNKSQARDVFNQNMADALAYFLLTVPGGADAFAESLLTLSSYSAEASDEHDVTTGEKTFNPGAGYMFKSGTRLTIAQTSDAAVAMECYVKSYGFLTGVLVVEVTRVSDDGIGVTGVTDWSISLSGWQGAGGDVNPSYAGNALKFARVNAGETALEYAPVGFELLGTIADTVLNGASTAVFSGLDFDEYSTFLLICKCYTAASVSYQLKLSDGVGTDTVNIFTAQQYSKLVAALVHNPTGQHVATQMHLGIPSGTLYGTAQGGMTERDDISSITLEVSGGTWSGTGGGHGAWLYGAK